MTFPAPRVAPPARCRPTPPGSPARRQVRRPEEGNDRVARSILALAGLLLAHCVATEVDVVEPLVVVSIGPSHGAVAIDPSTTVVVTFSRPLDVASVTASSCALSPLDSGGEPLAATPAVLEVSDDAQTVVLTPTAPLAAATRHRLTLSTAITDIDGLQLPAEVTTEFETL